jgi:hypothetical protein
VPDPVLGERVREGEDQAEPEPQVLDGPDPREWRNHSVIRDKIEDIEAMLRVQAAMTGSNSGEAGPAYAEAMAFLRASIHQVRGELAMELVTMYGIQYGEEPASPFSASGKARAFGAEQAPPAAHT